MYHGGAPVRVRTWRSERVWKMQGKRCALLMKKVVIPPPMLIPPLISFEGVGFADFLATLLQSSVLIYPFSVMEKSSLNIGEDPVARWEDNDLDNNVVSEAVPAKYRGTHADKHDMLVLGRKQVLRRNFTFPTMLGFQQHRHDGLGNFANYRRISAGGRRTTDHFLGCVSWCYRLVIRLRQLGRGGVDVSFIMSVQFISEAHADSQPFLRCPTAGG